MLNTIGDSFFKLNPNKILGEMTEGFRGRIIVKSSNDYVRSYFNALFLGTTLPEFDNKEVKKEERSALDILKNAPPVFESGTVIAEKTYPYNDGVYSYHFLITKEEDQEGVFYKLEAKSTDENEYPITTIKRGAGAIDFLKLRVRDIENRVDANYSVTKQAQKEVVRGEEINDLIFILQSIEDDSQEKKELLQMLNLLQKED